MVAYQEMDAPLDKGCQTGRLTLGAVSGKPEAVFGCYRQMLLETRYPALAKSAGFGAIKKQFKACFAGCKYLPPCSDDGLVEAEGRMSGSSGFVLLFNSASDARTVSLPLSDAALGLSGEVSLSDWTTLDKPADMGSKKVDEKIEIEVPANGYRIIGVNVHG